ncbi:MAG: RHS repeat-associated core domain-containing protein [Lachnospiraceae bacterium]|nr:RHS repeat-associated core domain-containing protein [Lachnospiraceae bacterium]
MPAGKDNYGRTLQDIGEKTFIPFRFQGQYEDEETGLYYNRFRYYDPETGQYTQQDPIGLAGGNLTLYGYVYNTLGEIDPFGLTWKDILAKGLGHHLFPRSVAKKLGISELAKLTALSWYPNVTEGSGKLHQDLHRLLKEAGVPFHGSKFTGTLDDFWEMAEKAYAGLDDLGYLKIPGTSEKLYKKVTPREALAIIKELYESGELPTVCGK